MRLLSLLVALTAAAGLAAQDRPVVIQPLAGDPPPPPRLKVSDNRRYLVTAVDGRFERGDAVIVRSPSGAEIARGLVAYDSDEARRLVGRRSSEIETVLGYPGRAAMIHRDDLVVV